ncbi:MAG: cold shock domain-containing protein, partial [Bacilli bacterium]|nr:cold shock domain-containing protein [Bacilli bacterium]
EGFKTLNEGQVVKFDLIHTDKGLQAINVESTNVATVV